MKNSTLRLTLLFHTDQASRLELHLETHAPLLEVPQHDCLPLNLWGHVDLDPSGCHQHHVVHKASVLIGNREVFTARRGTHIDTLPPKDRLMQRRGGDQLKETSLTARGEPLLRDMRERSLTRLRARLFTLHSLME